MIVLKYIFETSIIYIVFAIFWFFISGMPKLLLGASKKESFSAYFFKSVQYYLLTTLTVLQTSHFIQENSIGHEQVPFFMILGGVLLFLHLAGTTDKAVMSVQIQSQNGKIELGGALKYEPHIVGIAIIIYVLAYSYPALVQNAYTLGLHSGLLDFYNTFFIHGVISFICIFFMISMFTKGINATTRLIEVIQHLITGKPLSQRKVKQKNPFGGFNQQQNPFGFNNNLFQNTEEKEITEDEEYVDFEEIEDED